MACWSHVKTTSLSYESENVRTQVFFEGKASQRYPVVPFPFRFRNHRFLFKNSLKTLSSFLRKRIFEGLRNFKALISLTNCQIKNMIFKWSSWTYMTIRYSWKCWEHLTWVGESRCSSKRSDESDQQPAIQNRHHYWKEHLNEVMTSDSESVALNARFQGDHWTISLALISRWGNKL